jgi:hypothetical protein
MRAPAGYNLEITSEENADSTGEVDTRDPRGTSLLDEPELRMESDRRMVCGVDEVPRGISDPCERFKSR